MSNDFQLDEPQQINFSLYKSVYFFILPAQASGVRFHFWHSDWFTCSGTSLFDWASGVRSATLSLGPWRELGARGARTRNVKSIGPAVSRAESGARLGACLEFWCEFMQRCHTTATWPAGRARAIHPFGRMNAIAETRSE